MAKVKFYYKSTEPTTGLIEGGLYFISNGTTITLKRYSGTKMEEIAGDKFPAVPDGENAFLLEGKVNEHYLPDSIMGGLSYKGSFKTSTVGPITGLRKGWYYICNEVSPATCAKNPDGTDASVAYTSGDWAIYNGVSWDRIDAHNEVQSVAGLKGAISAADLGAVFTEGGAEVGWASGATLARKAAALNVAAAIGGTNTPVYINSNGVPVACGHSFSEYLPLTGSSSITGSLIPSEDGPSLGSSTHSWADLYVEDAHVGGDLYVPNGHIYYEGTDINAKYLGISAAAASAVKFNSNRTIALTGNVSGSASSDGSSGWSIATTIGAGVVTNAMLAGSIANAKLANSSLTIAGEPVSLGGSLSAATLGAKFTSSAPAGYATNAGTATKVGANLVIKFNGGSSEGTNLFTFNGSTAKTVDITASAIGAVPLSGSEAITGNLISSNGSKLGSLSKAWEEIHGQSIYGYEIYATSDIYLNGENILNKFALAGHTHLYAGSSSAGGAATSAIKLNTARTLTIGSTGKSFNGTANVSWTLAEIGAAAASDLEWLS